MAVQAVYVETSALARVLLEHPDRPAIVAAFEACDKRVSSRLLRVELRRVALRDDKLADADGLLDGVALVELDDGVLGVAETVLPSTVRTLDAIHLATALRLAEHDLVDAVMTYDKRLADAAAEHGLAVLSPR